MNRVFPFYNPSNNTPAFSHNSTTRKSFSRGNQKLRLSIGGTKPSRLVEENEDNRSPSLDGHSSPNLSLELVDESAMDPSIQQPPALPSASTHPLNGHSGNSINITLTDFDATYTAMSSGNIGSGGINIPLKKLPSSSYHFPTIAPNTVYSSYGGSSLGVLNFDGPSSLKMPGERGDIYQYEHYLDPFNQESEISFNESFPPVITNYDNTEMVEDFPVNTNLHQPPGSLAGTATNGANSNSVSSTTSTANFAHPPPKTAKPKTTSHITKRTTQVTSGGVKTSVSSTFQQRNKLSQVSSVSTTELHKMDDNMLIKKSASSHIVVNKNKAHVNKENARNKNITVQIITKPPTRSRTSLELRSPQKQAQHSAAQRQTQVSRVEIDTLRICSSCLFAIDLK